MAHIPFTDPRAIALLDQAIVKARAAGKLADSGRWTWAIGAGCIPYPPSDSAVRLATQVFDAGVQYGTGTTAFLAAAQSAEAVFATLKPGWLGSILSAIAVPASIAIAGVVGGEAIGALAGGSSGIPPAPPLDPNAPDLKGLPNLPPLETITSLLGGPNQALLGGGGQAAPLPGNVPTPGAPAIASSSDRALLLIGAAVLALLLLRR